ncbi:MAG: glycosyltransferase [Pseudomonadota bacterium]
MQKYIHYFSKHCIDYLILGWDRLGQYADSGNIVYYRRPSSYNFGAKAVGGRLFWMWHVFSFLRKNRNKFDYIHACDFDTALPAVAFKLLFRKKMIFDVFDWFTDTIRVDNRLVELVIRVTEYLTAKCSDVVVLCENERLPQIGFQPKCLLVLPNIPNIEPPKKYGEDNHSNLVISYVGGFYQDRNIELLLEVVTAMPQIRLKIAGYGDHEIEKMCTKLSTEHSNIEYYGRVPYTDGLEIMSNSHYLYAMYCKVNKNHLYAAPNKFYESLMLGRPIITTEGTLVGEKVLKHQTGYVIGEDKQDLIRLLNSLLDSNQKQYEAYATRCRDLWLNHYSHCVDDFFAKEYIPLILHGLY